MINVRDDVDIVVKGDENKEERKITLLPHEKANAPSTRARAAV